jgi:integrase
MRWGDIDWGKSRIIVRSPKTEHHEGKETRTIPIFPEIRTYLERAWDEAPEGAVYVIGRYRNSNANLRTQLKRIIAAAGRKAWPKLFQNLRSTRETELAEDWPIHVVCAWIGNSEAVARNHYLQVTDEHYEKAAQKVRGQRRTVRAMMDSVPSKVQILRKSHKGIFLVLRCHSI